jgi:DNA-binding transcriptional regulator YiaG
MEMNSYRERRYKTGLNVRTFAKIIGSNVCSVYNWEQGKTSPRYPETEKNIDYLVDLIEKLKKDAKNIKKCIDILK